VKNEEQVRPLVVSIASVIIFLLGFALTVAATIAGVGMVMIRPPLPSIYVIATLFGIVAGPLLTLSGYNLWKMKRWAGQVAMIIVLFDLISTPFIHLSIPISMGDILAWIGDIIILILIFQSLKITKTAEYYSGKGEREK